MSKIEECHGCGKTVCHVTSLPEPPDGTRIEFENGTDVYAARRSDASSGDAGWTTGNGGRVWCEYGRTVPVTWQKLTEEFGACVLALAVRLVPVAEDLPNREQWPTQIYARRRAARSAAASSPADTEKE